LKTEPNPPENSGEPRVDGGGSLGEYGVPAVPRSGPAMVGVRTASGVSRSPHTQTAIEQACAQAQDGLHGRPADLVLAFFSAAHVDNAGVIAMEIPSTFPDASVLACSAQGVIEGDREYEDGPCVSVLAMSLPGVRVRTWTSERLPPLDGSAGATEKTREVIDASDAQRLTIMLADPQSVPVSRLLPSLNAAMGPRALLVGGLASASSGAPGRNVLISDRRVLRSGFAGVTLSEVVAGSLSASAVVSQGCRPFGPAMVITKAQHNVIMELGGRPAIEAVQEAIDALPDEDKQRLRQGLLVGRVIDEYKPHFGRGDYLIRNVVAGDAEAKTLAVNDLVGVGQTIRLHVRDAKTAEEDLGLLLDAQKLYDRPAGALLITCNMRGRSLFGEAHHDARAICRAFAAPTSGAQAAKAGITIAPNDRPALPLAGFFAAGEIGPIGAGQSFLHGHTACVVLLR
jgi:small ligand-binding sensory domain FIST